MTTTEIFTGIKNWVLSKLSLKQDVINDLAAIRSGSQAGSTAVQPSDLSSYFNNASYDTNTHRINFYHGQNVVAYVDASPFIVDGMVNDVRIENGYLVIDFNTDSGKQDISIPLTDIFDPSNYYNKTQTDGLLAQKQDVIQDLSDIRSGASAGATAVQPEALSSTLTQTVAESGVFDLSSHNAVGGVLATYADLSSAITALNALESKYKYGGMSFKFVCSSDNKYVQFRLMNQNWSTIITDWQGVDDVPAAGSNNLVKSGGIAEYYGTYLKDPNYVKLLVDSSNIIIEGVDKQGFHQFAIGAKFGEIKTYSTDNPEYAIMLVDKYDKIIYAIRKNGEICSISDSSISSKEKAFLKDSVLEYPTSKYLPIMQSLKLTAINENTGGPDSGYSTLTLSVMSDIHNDTLSLKRYVDFTNQYKAYIDDSIILGDIAGSQWNQYTDWNSIIGYNTMLKVVGNHDVFNYDGNASPYSNRAHWAPASACYERYMYNIQNWNVNYQENKCYYYKDYPSANIRLIVMDFFHFDSEQASWLQSILYGENNQNSALSLGRHVLIATHIPEGADSSVFDFFDCNFNCKDSTSLHCNGTNNNLSIVDNFQNAGGIFICYLFGHEHRDFIGNYTNYPRQTFIIFPTGKQMNTWRDTIFTSGTIFENQFTIFSVDSNKRFIRLYRVGAEYDRNMIHKGSIVIDYHEDCRKVIAQY